MIGGYLFKTEVVEPNGLGLEHKPSIVGHNGIFVCAHGCVSACICRHLCMHVSVCTPITALVTPNIPATVTQRYCGVKQ